MRALFVHGHKFRRIEGSIYSPGGLPDNVLSRYVDFFGELTVIGRIIEEPVTKSNYSKIVNPKIKIVDNKNMSKLIQRADVIIVRLPSINGIKAIRIAKKYKKPYLVEVVGCVFDAYWNYGLKGKLVAIPAYITMKAMVKDAPYAVYVTKSFLQRRYPCRNQQIALSDVSLESPNSNILDARLEKIRKRKDKLVIGTIGAVDVPYKGQEYVIKGLAKLKKFLPYKIEYQLIGGGNIQKLKELAKSLEVESCLVYKGIVPHDDVFKWLDNDVDIYIQPSRVEGLCRALLEAMSRGLPCLASDCGGNPELVTKEFLFSKKNKKEIPQKIFDLVIKIIDERNMIEQAERNYRISNEQYKKSLLDDLRSDFYMSFAEDNRSSNE